MPASRQCSALSGVGSWSDTSPCSAITPPAMWASAWVIVSPPSARCSPIRTDGAKIQQRITLGGGAIGRDALPALLAFGEKTDEVSARILGLGGKAFLGEPSICRPCCNLP